jgi:zinc protease
MDDLRAHYKMGYAPNNCTMVVVGDVTDAQIMELAKKYIQPIPSQAPPPPVRTKEPDQLGERRVIVSKPAQLPIQYVAYHIPAARDPDIVALDVMSAVLTDGQSSRLYNRLVDSEQLVLNVGGRAEKSLDPGLYVFSMTPRSGIDPLRTEKALFEELDRLRTALVPPEELLKAKNQLLAQHYRQLKTIAGRANLLGTYEVFYDDYNKLFSYPKDIEAVSAADVQRVAQKYFSPNNRTVATLIPANQSEVKK